ncbi:MAG: tyrosine-type recombinase/integrase [Candidatus Brocadiales bacterium]|nr:tyrosine-type recombinase/integrase [Candidatus Bathyanammoxibius sp.]
MKYLKFERGIVYYRRGKFRRRLDGEPGSERFLISWTRAHEIYEKKPRQPADTLALPGTFRAIAVAYLGSPEFKAVAAETKKKYRYNTDLACQFFGPHRAADITMKLVLEARDGLTATPAKANALMKQIRIIYGWGMPRGMVDHNPANFRGTSIKALRIGSHDPWPEPLIEMFLNEARPEIAWGVATCLYTGQRIGDVLRMSWADIEDGKITVIQQKTKKKLRIPQHPELARLLGAIPRRSVRILTSYTGRVWAYGRWQQAFTAERQRLCVQGFVIHGLRKNAVIRLIYAGCTVQLVGSITGQSNQMVDYYARQIDQERLAAVAMGKYAEWSKNEKSGESGELVKLGG